MAATGDKRYAAEKAGYSQPLTSASKALARPAVHDAIVKLQQQRMTNEALPLAVQAFIDVLSDPKTGAMAKIAAAKVVYEKTATQTDTADKPIHELTLAELNARIVALSDQARAVDVEILEQEPAASSGVFE
jgi:hypothetical protein